ncbi:MAG: ADP-ribose pyrophosphatase YjhB (NUDIX family) [Candidatus Paceibacteria bacterium]|jgi:ADP-ribose pyrophosphatase YjhB (NUDIX family)
MEYTSAIHVRCRGVIINKGKLLVVRHTGKDFLALPGGHLEFGEGPRECVSREILEELGIEPVIGSVMYVNTFTSGSEQSIEFFFEIKNAADYIDLENTHRTHAHEIEEYVWVQPTDDCNIMPKEFADFFKQGKLNYGDTIFIKN